MPTQTSAPTPPSELEGCVLATIARLGPCTTYAVRKAFASSLTSSWRASAGAIYPLIDKLVARGFVDEARVKGDARGTRRLTITETGCSALIDWVGDSSPALGAPTADPIRTRSYALDDLSLDRAAVIDNWKQRTREVMAHVEARISEFAARGERREELAHRGAFLQLEARLTWLEMLGE